MPFLDFFCAGTGVIGSFLISGNSGDGVLLVRNLAKVLGLYRTGDVSRLVVPVRESDDPGRDVEEEGRELDTAEADAALVPPETCLAEDLVDVLEGPGISALARDADDVVRRRRWGLARGTPRWSPAETDVTILAVEVLRVVRAEVDVEVGSVLARRGFSASALFTDNLVALLVVAVRGDAEGRARRLLSEGFFVILIGVVCVLLFPRLRFSSSSSCAERLPPLALFPRGSRTGDKTFLVSMVVPRLTGLG